MPAPVRAGDRRRTCALMGVGLTILVLSHAALYLFLTGDARAGMAEIEHEIPVSQLEGAGDPGDPPAAGTPAYSPWLREYERWYAARAYGLHARHEGMIRWGMLLSLLVSAGFVVASASRSAPHRRRATAHVAPARASMRPHRPAIARPHPSSGSARPARVVALRPAQAAVKPQRVRRSA